ncbi:MAG: histidinol-phosphatase HisJ family protein [Firmicutes bacterium]|nr:histidinol-phosphatase HisJ family protein [Bacillota bacterium]
MTNLIKKTTSTPLKENLHTHTLWCDGSDTVEEIILSAIAADFDVIGFSGHSYTSFDESYCMSLENTNTYVMEIGNLAQKYQGQITIFCGIEQDYYSPPISPSFPSFDYIIGSVHAFFKPCTAAQYERLEGYAKSADSLGLIPASLDGKKGCYIYVDWQRDDLEWAIKNLYGGDSLLLAEDYFQTVSHVQEKTGCQIIGHFDLLTKFNQQGSPLFDCSHPRYQTAVDKALDILLPSNPIFEINTGAMAKGYRTVPYPSAEILKKIRSGGGRITLSSDCHSRNKLDYAFSEAAKLAMDCGFTSLWLLDRHGKWISQSL